MGTHSSREVESSMSGTYAGRRESLMDQVGKGLILVRGAGPEGVLMAEILPDRDVSESGPGPRSE